ncbi:MAG: thiosulfate oxidation carrier protein SoxY [Candidatus Puniceispirillales bacterium]
MKQKLVLKEVSRRHALGLIGGTIAMSSIAMPVLADAGSVAAKVNSLTGGASTTDEGVMLDLPEIAENGNAVKVGFEIDSPMTDGDHVKAVHVMADGNPTPDVASFNFSPANGACMATTRMRLAKTQNIIVLAEMSDGSFRQAAAQVKVTIGGCGG